MEQFLKFQNLFKVSFQALKDSTNHLKWIKTYWRVGLLLAFFLFNSFSHATVVGVFDTGFCPDQIANTNSNIKILKTIDLTQSVTLNCQKNIPQGRLHGQKVISTIISHLKLKGDQKIKIQPYIIFDKNRSQSLEYWRKAFTTELVAKLDLLVFAAGYPTNDIVKIEIPKNKMILLSQGRFGRGIEKNQQLWPQREYQKYQNIIIIGGHYPKSKYHKGSPDKKSLYLKEAHYYFPNVGHDRSFMGSSYSVAMAAARAINICSKELSPKCLKEKSKHLDWDYPMKARTY